jgi:hypothetical protein
MGTAPRARRPGAAMPPKPTESNRMEALVLLAFVAAWFVLQVWLLPRAGVPT